MEEEEKINYYNEKKDIFKNFKKIDSEYNYSYKYEEPKSQTVENIFSCIFSFLSILSRFID